MKIEENKEEYNPQHLTTEKFHTDQSKTETGTSRDNKDEELSNVPSEKVLNASEVLSNDSKVSDEQLNDAILKDNDTTIDKISGAPDKINENGTKTKRMKQSEVLVNQTMPDKTTDQAKDGGTKTKKMTESTDASGKGKRKRYKLKCKNCTCENCPLKEYQKKKKAGKLEEVVGPVCKCEPKCACMDCEYIKRLRELLCNTVCGGTPKPEIETPDPGRDTPEPGTNNIPEPVKDTPSPVTGTPEPKTYKPKPGTDTPEPKTDTPEPKTDTPKPGTDTPEPGRHTPETATDNKETDTPKTPTRNCLPCCCPELIQKKRKCKCICAGKSGTFDGNPTDSANDRLTREASKNQSLTQISSENGKTRKKLLLADNVQDNVQSAKEHSKNVRHSETKSKDQPDSKYDIQYVSVILPSSDTALKNCCKLCREENRFFDSKEEEVGCPKEQEVGCPKEQVESCPNDSKSTESGEGNTKDAEDCILL
ncbi:proteoglycan 4-like isoform X2 [Chrysoperla carnea]|uniref:proteoglycan 4-like isoform X2 n=1 Tax=Chrysoperla carnea TaxID=189513 RepID=UPI001D06BA77|nr:proteoglycan 4-like isoform X2 [Chrysoperla carnea]